MSGAGSDISTTDSGEGVRTLTAADIATVSGGELRGDPTVRVGAVAPLHRAGGNDVTFLAKSRYAPLLAERSPGVLLVTPALREGPPSWFVRFGDVPVWLLLGGLVGAAALRRRYSAAS